MAGDLYYQPEKNKLEVFQVDTSCPSMGVDSAYFKEGYGWSKTLKGYPEDYGWVYIGDMGYDWKD